MIHDAIVTVTCDNKDCIVYKDIKLSVALIGTYTNYVNGILRHTEKWIIIDGKHYCSEECAREAEDGS